MGHGETYRNDDDILWWSKGGILHGTSPKRIQFLRDIMEARPGPIDPMNIGISAAGIPNQYYLAYLGPHQSSVKTLKLPEDVQFKTEIIDTWEMTIEEVDGTFSGTFDLEVPGKPYMALRITKI
ncbi:MAG: DUF5605 domain-containing protein [Candidatus Latescibacteria bacterium]|nr:DUF5605 domain-containing protein [Candidatus Latescibacterota bacterium]MBT4139911.1 DUF5605 domain-containing protein [Candidatus Latescibacterota bacterium]MBT5833100.1 DUF5605 domain-containing protein [Candidatus Latescibacterota bacterium]